MSAPQRIRLSRARGFRLPENAIVVARPSRWGNPFVVGIDGTRLQCAAKFAILAEGFISLGSGPETDVQLALWRRIRRSVADLAGHDLACWCPLDGGACHGDVLLLLANPGLVRPAWMCRTIDLGSPRIGMDARQLDKLKRRQAAEVKLQP